MLVWQAFRGVSLRVPSQCLQPAERPEVTYPKASLELILAHSFRRGAGHFERHIRPMTLVVDAHFPVHPGPRAGAKEKRSMVAPKNATEIDDVVG